MAEIKVNIIGENGDLIKSVAQAEAELRDFEKAIKNATDPADIERLNKAIQATKTQLSGIKNVTGSLGLKKVVLGANEAGQSLTNLGRIAQDAPFGFIGIQNNISPLLESFTRLKASTGTTGGALKALASSLGGAGGLGLAVSVVTSLLTVFSKELFGSKSSAEGAEDAVKSYTKAIDTLKESVDAVSDSVAFANRLGSINVKISGFGKTTGNELQDLREQSVAQDDLIASNKDFTAKLVTSYYERTADLDQSSKEFLDITEKYNKDFKDVTDQGVKLNNDQRVIYRQIALAKLEDQKTANDEAKKLSEDALKRQQEAVNETIAQAKRLASYLQRNTIREVRFETDPEDSLQEQYQKALQFIQKASKDAYVINFPVKLNIFAPAGGYDFTKLVKGFGPVEAKQVQEALQRELDDAFRKNPIIIQFKADIQKAKDKGDALNQKLGINGRAKDSQGRNIFTDQEEDAILLANTLNNTLQPAFDGLVDAIAAGENPIEAFFQGVGQALQDLVKQILAAVVKAAILSAIAPGGAGGFGAIFGSLFGARMAGGAIAGGQPYLVGEAGAEVFVPRGSGRIVPNKDLNAGLRSVQAGTQTIRVIGEVSGRNLRLINARQSNYENRNA